MTTTGPEPGWCLDPDGGENERYWNGTEWTEHRRSQRPTVSQPPESFSHPADIVDSMPAPMLDGRHQAGSVSEEGVRSHDANTLTPRSSWSSIPTTWASSTVERPVDWPADADTPAEKPMPRRRRAVVYYLFTVLAVISAGLTLLWGIAGLFASIEVGRPQGLLLATLWGGAWTALWVWLARRTKVRSENPDPTSGPPATQTPETAPPSESTELRLRGWAEVVGGDKWGFIGWAGKIVTIDSDNVGLKFEGYSGTYYFQRNHVVPAATEDQPDGRPMPKSSPPDPLMGPAPTLQRPPSLKPATAHPFPQLLTSARDQVPRVKRFWAGLPVAGRIAAVAAPVLIIVVIIGAIASNSRDEGSYQYGRTTSSTSARMLWKAAQSVGAETGDYGNVRSPEDACRIDVEVSRDAHTRGAEVVRKLDIKDVIDGCTDVLEAEVRLGYLPAPAG